MSLDFDPNARLIIVPTRLWGPTGDIIARLALDTGATITTLSWDIAVLLGYDPAAVQDRTRVTTGSAVEFAPRIAVQKIEALQQERHSFQVLCLSLPASLTVDGVLGLDFFRGLRLVIDLRRGRIEVDAGT